MKEAEHNIYYCYSNQGIFFPLENSLNSANACVHGRVADDPRMDLLLEKKDCCVTLNTSATADAGLLRFN